MLRATLQLIELLPIVLFQNFQILFGEARATTHSGHEFCKEGADTHVVTVLTVVA